MRRGADRRDNPLADNIGHWIDNRTVTIEAGGLERPLADPSVGCTDFHAMQILKRALARYLVDVSGVQFIPPALPRLRAAPPAGDGWLFELKFDGWLTQLHKAGLSSWIFGRNGGDLSRRFPRIAAAVLGLPTKSFVVDGELIAAGRHGQLDFLALLHGRHVPTCVYCFDLLELNGRDLREQPLVQRRARLQASLARGKCNLLRFSESFPDANTLLAECSRRGLEGIVAKRKDSIYRSGTRSGWIKVKTEEWKAANRYRAKLFEKT